MAIRTCKWTSAHWIHGRLTEYLIVSRGVNTVHILNCTMKHKHYYGNILLVKGSKNNFGKQQVYCLFHHHLQIFKITWQVSFTPLHKSIFSTRATLGLFISLNPYLTVIYCIPLSFFPSVRWKVCVSGNYVTAISVAYVKTIGRTILRDLSVYTSLFSGQMIK